MTTIITLPESMHREIKHLAVDESTSMAEIVRRALELYLKTARKGGRKS